MEGKNDHSAEIAALMRTRPRAYRRTFMASVFFWLFLFAGIGFLINTAVVLFNGLVLSGMIGVTSSQIAYSYQVSEAEIHHLLVASVHPVKYATIGYSLGLSLSFFVNAIYCRKIFRRGRYIVTLETLTSKKETPPPPAGN